jgi:beta-N-acetylhexosaminidase
MSAAHPDFIAPVSEWPAHRLAGQRLMVGFDGTRLDATLRQIIEQRQVGGIILFTRNIVDHAQLQGLCASVQACAREAGALPLFIAIDQEGGSVARLKPPFTQFPGPSEMKDKAQVKQFARITAKELGAVGVNMNMAPVMDLLPEGVPSVMAGRSFGTDPAQVSAMGTAVISHLQRRRIMAVAKHFPGIGRTTDDSHIDMPLLDAGLEVLQAGDLIPFQAAIEADVSAVMLAHIFYPAIDSRWPASLSPAIAHDLLRGAMGYEGVVITDDLDMGAIKKHFPVESVIEQVLAAEIDIALICHAGPDIARAHDVLTDRISISKERQTRAVASVERILQLKRRYLLC